MESPATTIISGLMPEMARVISRGNFRLRLADNQILSTGATGKEIHHGDTENTEENKKEK